MRLPAVTVAIDGSVYERHPKFHGYMMEMLGDRCFSSDTQVVHWPYLLQSTALSFSRTVVHTQTVLPSCFPFLLGLICCLNSEFLLYVQTLLLRSIFITSKSVVIVTLEFVLAIVHDNMCTKKATLRIASVCWYWSVCVCWYWSVCVSLCVCVCVCMRVCACLCICLVTNNYNYLCPCKMSSGDFAIANSS